MSKPGAWLAAWMYAGIRISRDIDEMIHHYHSETLQGYWDPERNHVDENYTTIPFPFEEIVSPLFQIRYDWTLEELEGYLETWSALQKFMEKNKHNPAKDLIRQIRPYWAGQKMPVHFPVYLRMGKILK